MRIGISSACFYPYINTEDTLEIIKETGADICEVFLEAECETTEEYCLSLKEKADKVGIDIYSVHPYSVSFEPFLFDRYERRRLEMGKKFRAICRAGEILGAECYVFHGIRKTPDFPNIDNTAKGMDNLCKIAGEYGIKLAWENVAWCMSCSPRFLELVRERMKEDIYFNLDIKQAVRSGYSPESYIDVFKDKIINVHINDASKKSTCLLPGYGDIDLKSIVDRVKSLNPDTPFIIEVYSENFTSYEELKISKGYMERLEERE